jgi:hypothetical protein
VGGVDAFVTSKNKNSKLNSELYHLSLWEIFLILL